MSWNINQKPRPPLDVLREKIRTLKEKSMKLQWELEVLRNTMNRMKSTCLKLKNENACLKRADRSFENAGGGGHVTIFHPETSQVSHLRVSSGQK